MTTTIVETFTSPPDLVREGILEALTVRAPQIVHLLQWDSSGTRASGSKMGGKGTLELVGEGPTTATVKFSIGFPASLKYSEAEAEIALRQAIKELKSRVP